MAKEGGNGCREEEYIVEGYRYKSGKRRKHRIGGCTIICQNRLMIKLHIKYIICYVGVI